MRYSAHRSGLSGLSWTMRQRYTLATRGAAYIACRGNVAVAMDPHYRLRISLHWIAPAGEVAVGAGTVPVQYDGTDLIPSIPVQVQPRAAGAHSGLSDRYCTHLCLWVSIQQSSCVLLYLTQQDRSRRDRQVRLTEADRPRGQIRLYRAEWATYSLTSASRRLRRSSLACTCCSPVRRLPVNKISEL